ncbi:6-phosphofructokinase [Methylomusa anaerophila]|uniref:ATP-dependent 6-phosphofructokinase n=1 Tax=Methylomusa anaerophila TaxID=1930071 RepID=A0A348AR13_9FIRM|nr:6-phosphofructokinase [Methylomusa anaerophila]
MKKIGVITSGGDCPGMNAAIRAVVRVAQAKGMEVLGIKNGYAGMISRDFVQLDSRSVGDIIQKGGTFLGTARCEEFKTLEGRQTALSNLQQKGVEGLVIIGGDGSLTGGKLLSELGMKVVGMPGTIDNDIWGTDYTIGFDTAVNTVLDSINKLRDTASAHGRVMLVEVMGRKSGWIALTAGLTGGAEIILVPEIPYDLNDVCRQLRDSRAKGKQYSIVVVAEGVGSAITIGEQIRQGTGLETRVSVLGHIQRGGAPTVTDRLLASRMSEMAVTLLQQGVTNVMVGIQCNQMVPVIIDDAIGRKKDVDAVLFRLAEILSQ